MADSDLEWSDLEWEDTVLIGPEDILQFNEDNILPLPLEAVERVRAWLQPTDYAGEGSDYRKHLAAHLPGTGQWFLSSNVYTKWLREDEHGMLWVRGVPGSGKSVLAASIIKQLSQEHVPVLYFFFRQIIDANRGPDSALRDWLAQILPFSPPLQTQLLSYLDAGPGQDSSHGYTRTLESLSTTELWRHLRGALSHLPMVYVVVDALDEMNEGEDTETFLRSLASIAHWRPSQIKVFATSRATASVERALRREKILRLRLEESKIDVDIRAYVESRLANSHIPAEFHPSIRAAIPGKANGLFLYAKLAMDAVLKLETNDPIRFLKSIQELPGSLNIMYSQLLREHGFKTGLPVEVQILILQAATHSIRPMRLIEVAELVNVTFPSQISDLKTAKSAVRSACGPLLEVLPDETLCVVHHSLTEFLLGTTRNSSDDYPLLEPGFTHKALAISCLSYLMSGCLQNVRIPEMTDAVFLSDLFGDPPEWSSLRPLTKYAVENWHVHVKKAASYGLGGGDMNGKLDEFRSHPDFPTWVVLAKLEDSDFVSPLSMAVALGLTDYLEYQLARPGTDIRAGVPIALAADKGYLNMVKVLVDHGADVFQRDAKGYTALQRAVNNDYVEIISTLLQAGCDPDVPEGTQGYSQSVRDSLWDACRNGQAAAVSKFLPYLQSKEVITDAIVWAVSTRKATVVETLLQHPTFDPRELALGRALTEACLRCDLSTIKLLIAAGADPNATEGPANDQRSPFANHERQSPLIALAKEPQFGPSMLPSEEMIQECFILLIDAGADVNQGDHNSNTALHFVRNPKGAKLLLEAGANVEARNRQQETPLHTNSSPAAIRVLVKNGKANLESTDYRARTALLSSLDRNYLIGRTRDQAFEKALTLIELGANVNATDRDGNSPMHVALNGLGHDEFVSNLINQLCKAGANLNLRNANGETPMHLVKFDVRSPIFQTLIEAGGTIEPGGDEDKDASFKLLCDSLFSAKDDELPQVRETLVRSGLRLDFTDSHGSSLLHAAIASQGPRVLFKGEASGRCIQFLIDSGLDPEVTDNEGNTMWHAMALSSSASKAYGYRLESFTELKSLLKNPEQAQKLSTTPLEDLIGSERYWALAIRPFDTLLRLGLDPRQPNHRGRTPLHYLSAIWPEAVHEFKTGSSSGLGQGHVGKTTAFDFLLPLYADVDCEDKNSITPLHLASTFSEYQTRRLLNAGADPSKTTSEGCNTLHIAARSRAANIVGMLLCAIRSQATTSLPDVVNKKDVYGRTPLYYACASGLFETVKLLIDAGAEVETQDYESSPWKAFASNEEEARIWRLCGQDWDEEFDAGGVMIDDERRPQKFVLRVVGERSEEIISLLISNGPGATKFIDLAIEDAAKAEDDVTVEHLLRARQSLALEELQLTPKIQASIDRRQMERDQFWKPCEKCHAIHQRGPLGHIWRFEGCHPLPDALSLQDCVQYDMEGRTLLHRLVRMGLVPALRQVVTLESVQKIEDPAWCLEQEGILREKGSWEQLEVTPLLLEACKRSQPSMDVITLLVEVVGVDIDAQHHDPHESANSYSYKVQSESPLHAVIRGENWWQTSQALPYLLKRGANTELKDSKGMTPLSAALERTGWLIFNKRAVHMLVQHGADVNAVDNEGISCLSKALFDREIVEMLLNHGARVSHDVLLNMVALNNPELNDPELLRFFLSRGADPNLRGWRDCGAGQAMYPLHRLLSKSKYDIGEGKRRLNHEKMIRLLLEHGANICAAYPGTTILHELIKDGHSILPTLSTMKPPMDLTCRNDAGDTPLLRACHPKSSGASSDLDLEGRTLIEFLVMNGADVHATANDGSTALHYFFDSASFTSFRDVEFIVSVAPELINTPNNAGDTPLHLAMARAHSSYREVDLFLEKNGDVHMVNDKGETMLHLLLKSTEWSVNVNGEAYGKTKDYFTRLLSMGLDVNARNHAGETPIFYFFRHCGVWFIRRDIKAGISEEFAEQSMRALFTETGVDWQVANSEGQNLLHVVAGSAPVGAFDTGESGRTFKALLDMGLDVGLEDNAQMTPLDVAAAAGNDSILALFSKGNGDGTV